MLWYPQGLHDTVLTVRTIVVLVVVLGISSVALAQDGFVPHDCVQAADCQECSRACERRYAPEKCTDHNGCWTPKMRNQTRVCIHDVCGWPAPPWHEPEN